MSKITRADIRQAARENGWDVRPPEAGYDTLRSDIFYRPGPGPRGGMRITVRYRHLDGKGWTGGVTDLFVDGWSRGGKDKGRQAMDLLSTSENGARSQ